MIDIVGLGPGDADRIPEPTRRLLLDESRPVVLRTIRHPAAAWLAARRDVTACDDLYEASSTFADVYAAIADRVTAIPEAVYAVPGSPMVGELAVAAIRQRGGGVTVHPAESFLDVIFAHFGVDPLADGFQLLNGHDLPMTLVFDVVTVIGHLDRPETLAEVLARLGRTLPEEATVAVAVGLGSADASVAEGHPDDLDADLAGLRTSIVVRPMEAGVSGVISVMHRLRRECPWDRSQTHESLIRHLSEETAELIDAVAALGEERAPGAYADVEEELGDVLLQVLFHAAMAEQAGAFDMTDVAESLRRKLVRRHPHVFGDVVADDAGAVTANWDAIKRSERGGAGPDSAIGAVPASMPPLPRSVEVQRKAAAVGFDWAETAPVLDKIGEEIDEVRGSIVSGVGVEDEVGDLLFAVANAARHLGVDPDVALGRATHRFEDRFRRMEAEGPLDGLGPGELDARWERAKAAQRRDAAG